jgi:hypothetical protein
MALERRINMYKIEAGNICKITRAILTEHTDGYLTIEYQDADGNMLARHSSYSMEDMERSLEEVKRHFPDISIREWERI